MANASVFTPLFDTDAVRSVNFFNGRLLSSEDLTTERRADREERRRLAEAIGPGVVRGFSVSSPGSGTTVTVTSGLALDGDGDSICLPNDTDVSLLELKQAAAGEATVEPFAHCVPPESGTYVAGAGVYVLTVSRALGATGFAPVSGLGNELAGCNRRYLVEGVEFRLPKVTVSNELLAAPALLRNRLAYDVFGTTRLQRRVTSALSDPGEPTDLLSTMRKTGAIGSCDVPLALIYWSGATVQFVDMWAVRRRPSTALAGTPDAFVDPAHAVQGEARLLQFQAQLGEIIGKSLNPTTIEAGSHFTYLPAAAFLPITGVREDGNTLKPVASSAVRALDYERFFGARMKTPPRVIEAARVPLLVRESLTCPPIDVNGEQMFWLYVTRENRQSVESGDGAVPYLIVASPHLRYQAEPRFDVSYSNYANFL